MASYTLMDVFDVFPGGTSVEAYAAANWRTAGLPPAGAPQGSATATATVDAGGEVAFTGLSAGEGYYAAAQIGGTWRYMGFTAPDDTTPMGLDARVDAAEASLLAVESGSAWGEDDGFLRRVGDFVTWAPGQGGVGAHSEHLVKGDGAAVAATTITLDRAPVAVARVGKVAVGVGLETCEIREVASSVGAAITVNSAFFYDHDADESVVYFDGWRVPLAWWGIQGNVSTTDNRAAMCAALRAVGKSIGTNGAPLLLDGQGRDIYVSGPVTIVQGTALESFRLRAMSTYSGPTDGPDNPAFQTNAMMMLGQTVQRVTYSSATNTFTTTNADGTAVAHGMGVTSRTCFDPDPSLPPGVVAGRTYRAVEIPTASTFRIAHQAEDSPLTFAADGTGWAHVGLGDNCKLYARKVSIEGNNVGRRVFTALASTDVFTTTTAHGFAADDEIRFNISGTLPGGVLASSSVYYARDVTSTTFKVAATPGGAAIDVTSDGGGHVMATRSALNGAIWGMQQPSFTDHIRVDNCKGFGIRVKTQQSVWRNLELINNGTNLEIGGEVDAEVGEFCRIDTFNAEQADVCEVKIRTGKNISIGSWHSEDTEHGDKVMFDIRCKIALLQLENCWFTIGGGGTTLFRIEGGAAGGTSYKITGLNGTFPTSAGECIAIDDRDRGTYLDMWTDFAGEGFAEYEAWSTTATSSREDPHPYRWDGLMGQSEWRGAQNTALPYNVIRHGARKISDIHQWKTWATLPAATTLDVTTDTFTSAGHGLTEDQEIHVYTGTTPTMNGESLWVNDTIYRARNVTTDTFQISHVPGAPILDFATAGSWTVRKVQPVKLRINKDARLINGHGTAIADADLVAGESSWHFDPSTGAFVFKGKKADNSLVTVPLASAASQITFTPAGAISAVDVQNAIEEVALEAGANGDGGWGRTAGVLRRANYYYALTTGVTTSDGSFSLNQTYYIPFWIDKTQTLIGLGIWATTAAGAGGVVRFGVNACDAAEFKPGALLLDAGTVTNTTATSFREVTISLSLIPGAYWVSMTPQGATTGNIARVSPVSGMVGTTAVIASTPNGCYFQGSISGALPDPAAPTGSVTTCPLVWGHYAP